MTYSGKMAGVGEDASPQVVESKVRQSMSLASSVGSIKIKSQNAPPISNSAVFPYAFSDLVDIEALHSMLRSFYEATGILHGLVDTENNVISAIGWQDACTKFHRVHPVSNERCLASNRYLCENLGTSGYVGCACANGLMDYATPIMVEGHLLATLYFGQVFHQPPDVAFFRKQGKEFEFDEEAYLDAIGRVPVVPKERVDAIMEFYGQLAQMLANMGLARLRQREMERHLADLNVELGIRVEERTAALEEKNKLLHAEVEERKCIEGALRFVADPGNSAKPLAAMVRYLGEVLGVAYVVVDRLAKEPGVAESVAYYCKGEIGPDIRYALEDTPCGNVVGKQFCCYPAGVQQLFPKDGLLVEMGVDSYAGIPLWGSDGYPIGLVAIMDSVPFESVNLVTQLLHILAPRAAFELGRAKHEFALERAATEFRNLAEASPDYIVHYGDDGRICYINGKLANDLDVLPEKVIGRLPGDVWLEGRFSGMSQAVERAIELGEETTLEFWVEIAARESRFHQIRVIPERDAEGEMIGAFAFGRDVTELKVATEKLQKTQEFTEAILNAVPDPIFVQDRLHRCVQANKAFCQLLGKSSSELIGKTIRDFLPGDQSRAPWLKHELVFSTGQEHISDESILDAEGNIRVVQTKMSLVDQSTLVGVIRDITEIASIQKSLLQAQAISMIGSWDWDVVRNHVEWSDMAYEIYTPDERPNSPGYGEFMQSVHPDDRERVDVAVKAALLQDIPFDIDHRVVSKSKGVRIVHAQAKVFRDIEGRPVRMVGTVQDFTERKEYEEKLRITASVFGAAQEGIIITDPTGIIIDVNSAFSHITGYSKEEAIGKRPNLIASGKHDRVFYQDMWSSLRQKGSWSGELINRRKDGELYHEHLNIVGVYESSESLMHYVGVFSDISQFKKHEQHLEHVANHDILTGLPNRLLLTDRLSKALPQTSRDNRMLAILYLDLDGFKPINDNFGHEIGDRVLKAVANRLAQNVRAGDTVARLGGDEFVILLLGLSCADECNFTIHRLLDVMVEPILVDSHCLNVSVSIGVSLFPNDGADDADMLLRCADQAMYVAKAAGRNQCAYFGANGAHKIQDDKQMVYDLRQALSNKQISVHYQPIIDTATGRVGKAEALVRWRHPERGEVPPSKFIPIAESAGLIQMIGDFVFREAARVAKVCNKQAARKPGEQIRICINRSPRQFFHRDGVSTWSRFLFNEGISGELLAVEITEGLLLEDHPDVLKQLNQLRALGMTISLDDFGTGYSALSYLKKFDIDYLKIDRSFVSGIAEDPSDRAIVEAIVVMAKRLGIKLVAEGVETQGQLDILSAVDCDMIQGYYYSKPLPEAEFLNFVSKVG